MGQSIGREERMLHHTSRFSCLEKNMFLALGLSISLSGGVQSAEEEDGIANYAYSVFSGTGRYKIDDRTIVAIRAPLVWDLVEADYETGKLGYRFLFPVAVGVTNFKDVDDFPDIDIDSLQTLGVAPGIEMVIPATPKWQVKPFAQGGYGFDLQSDSHTVIWGAGIRTRTSLGVDSNWLIGGEFLRAGEHPNRDAPATSFSRWGIGTEYRLPTDWQPYGHRVSWQARLLQWYFTDAVNFNPPSEKTTVSRSTEVGISFSVDPPISILGYPFTQGGIGYQVANGYNAITLFTTFPF